MPPAYVRTIREEIFYEYAKLISRSVFNGELNRGFITDRFKALRDGKASMSGTIREWQKEQELQQLCVFCNSDQNLQIDHLIPKSRGGTDSSDNLVLACQKCNASRGDRGVFEWLGLKEKDKLHRLVAGKYLKELFDLHNCKSTLDVNKNSLNDLCTQCGIEDCCREWKTEGKLSCFCLESVF